MKKTFIFILFSLVTLAGMAQRKSVSILGDSYSTFQDYVVPDTNFVWYPLHDGNKNDVTKVEETWWHILLKETGYKLDQNNSFSGSTIGYHGYGDEDYELRSFENRKSFLGCPDIILIFGGTNDSWSGTKVGEYKYEGWTKKDLWDYRPALAKMLEFMKFRYVNTDIYFILNTELRDDITESTLTLCKHYDIPVIKLHDIDKQAGHPSIKGMKQVAEQVKAAIVK